MRSRWQAQPRPGAAEVFESVIELQERLHETPLG